MEKCQEFKFRYTIIHSLTHKKFSPLSNLKKPETGFFLIGANEVDIYNFELS